ncbi:MAG: GAF domain-containing sensor histidine kinase, partial [Kiritimatiellia bacterium]
TSGRVERAVDGRPVRIRGVCRDFTGQKQSELALARTQRALHVSNACGHLVLQRTNELKMLQGACRIVVRAGGYQMAWIGFLEHEATRSLRLMALAGAAQKTFSRAGLPWASTLLGRGPAGAAIRNCHPYVCRDLAKDPQLALLRKMARPHDCRSALALPMLPGRECLGVMVIYSADPEAFDADEVQILQQLAGDISFAIIQHRNRGERNALMQQMLNISEREQRRIGQDLHDSVGQTLTGIRYLIDALQQEFAAKFAPEAHKLTRVTQMLAKTTQQVHDLAHGIFPEESKTDGLAVALQELARHTKDIFGLSCRFCGLCKAPQLANDITRQIYRIAQEAVHNAAKHSGAKTIEIRLSRRGSNVVLTVRDDGKGFPQSPGQMLGMGQRIMKYRADMIGATLKIMGRHGKGATVTCVLPTNHPHQKITP